MNLKLIFIVALIIGIMPFIMASNYYIEFNQEGNKVFANENNVSIDISKEALENTDSGYYFVKRIEADDDYNEFVVRLNLEEGVVANPEEIFPADFRSLSDGQIISLEWRYHNVSRGSVLAFFVSLEDKKNISSNSWLYYVIAIALVIIGFFLFRHFFNKRKDAGKYLLDDEKKVIVLLKDAEGKSLWQKNIQSSLGFSKAKLSRMIRNLESRNLIEKIPIGNTNKIKLK